MRVLALAALALLIVPSLAAPVAAHHSQPAPASAIEELDRRPGVTWRSVAFHPDGSHALLAGEYVQGNTSRDVIGRWSPGEEVTIVYNRSGIGLVDVAFDEDGRSLVVGLENTILLGRPGTYRNVWNESSFAQQSSELTFFGLGGAFEPGQRNAILTGSSLLRMNPDGSLEAIHGGRNAFFRSVDWNPQTPSYALVEAAIQRQDRTVLGTVWRTDGASSLAEEDNVAIYGRNAPGSALLNAIAFAHNGTFALLSGRDGAGASLYTWAALRDASHDHANRSEEHDHQWRYQPTSKTEGPITCIAWNPQAPYAWTTGLREDVVGVAGARSWTPLVHQGPDLYGCAAAPDGSYALAAGENGTLVRLPHQETPLASVVHPGAGTLVAPKAEQTFLVDVIDRGGPGAPQVSGTIDGNGTPQEAVPEGRWWALTVNTTDLADGRHVLEVNVTTESGTARLAHPFLVNNERFTPETPTMRAPQGLEGQGSDSDGVFTLQWDPLDAPVVYQVREESDQANGTRVLDAGGDANLTVRVTSDGTYTYSVRAANAYNESTWSESVAINVVLDTDGDGVPDKRDPDPRFPNQWGDPDQDGITTDVEIQQCSDPEDANSTPSSDDDGDGLSNGRECLLGTDPLDPNDPEPQTPDNDTDGNTSQPPEDNGTPGVGVLAITATLALVAIGARRRRR